MKISVIIPTYNEEKDISECLASLKNQTHTDNEIIVVDDGSTDKTLDNLTDVMLLKQKHSGAGMARNLGAKHAKGKILVFVDADMTFDKKFLEKLTAPIRSGKSRGTFSKEEYVSNWDNAWARCWNINQNLPAKKRLPKLYPDRQKVFRAILKTEFEKIGGFDKGGYTDDYSLSSKLNYEATVAPNAFFYHKNPSSLRQVFGQAKWVAKREYKLGLAGLVLTAIRSLPPISIFVGLVKGIVYKEPKFVLFKLVYDFAIIIGLFEMVIQKKYQK